MIEKHKVDKDHQFLSDYGWKGRWVRHWHSENKDEQAFF